MKKSITYSIYYYGELTSKVRLSAYCGNNFWSELTKKINNRYDVKRINHAGRTITLNESNFLNNS